MDEVHNWTQVSSSSYHRPDVFAPNDVPNMFPKVPNSPTAYPSPKLNFHNLLS